MVKKTWVALGNVCSSLDLMLNHDMHVSSSSYMTHDMHVSSSSYMTHDIKRVLCVCLSRNLMRRKKENNFMTVQVRYKVAPVRGCKLNRNP